MKPFASHCPALHHPRNCRARRGAHFTLSELLIASTMLAVVAAAMAPLSLTVYRSYVVSRAQAQFENEALTVQEWVKRDLASSARSDFLLWPRDRTTRLEAISLPVLRRTGNQGGAPVDSNNQIQWTHTVVYHIFEDENEGRVLRRTVFEPRAAGLTHEQRYQQLESVYLNGHGGNTFNAGNASTQTLARNVSRYLISSDQGEVDSYAPGYNVVEYHALGTWIIEPGYNTYRFTVTGANENSAGMNIGIDQIQVSASGLPADAECLLPLEASVGATAVSKSMAEFSGWSNNAELFFPASQAGSYMSLNIYNDTWLESTFVDDQARINGAEVTYCSSIEEIVCRMIGRVPSWEAQVQSLNNLPETDSDQYNFHSIRVIVSGREATLGENIAYPGRRATVSFKAAGSGSHSLYLRRAYIMEHDSGYNGVPGTVTQLTFPGQTGVLVVDSGQGAFIYPGHAATSNYAEFEIDPDKDYLVSYYVQTAASNDRATSWADQLGRVNTYTYQGRNEEGAVIAHNISGEVNWDGVMTANGVLTELERIVGVEKVTVSYPEKATYTSKIVDTRQSSPEYVGLNWRHDGSANTEIHMRIRAGDQPDLSDAVDWDNALLFTAANGVNSLAALQGRYVQWQAELRSLSPYMQTPSLRDVKVRWRGLRRAVDVAVAVGKGPNRGIFQLQVNDEDPRPAQLSMHFTLGREIDNREYTRDFSVQVSPRN